MRGPAIAYAQCWEDADVLCEALDVRPGSECLSIASGGDNTLALLLGSPRRVVAIDRNPAQLAALELRVAAFRCLDHGGLLELLGSVPSTRRAELYRRCRAALSPAARAFWDANGEGIAEGAGACGRFERYLALFRRRVLPLIHPAPRVERLLRGASPAARHAFYASDWDTWRWRLLFRTFFSRLVMGLGRDRSHFRHAHGSISAHLLERTRHACLELDPAANPYLRWILCGSHGEVLPLALRPGSFEPIRARLDRLEWHCTGLAEYLDAPRKEARFDRFNLSDVFEYLDPAGHAHLMQSLLRSSAPHARLAYWNLLVPRSCPAALAGRVRPLHALARALFARDKAFFYSAFVLEEVAA